MKIYVMGIYILKSIHGCLCVNNVCKLLTIYKKIKASGFFTSTHLVVKDFSSQDVRVMGTENCSKAIMRSLL